MAKSGGSGGRFGSAGAARSALMNGTYQIKSNGWHKVEIETTANGETLLTGDTFKCKEFIKNRLGGKWNGHQWEIDPEQAKKYLGEGTRTFMAN